MKEEASPQPPEPRTRASGSVAEIFLVMLRLGCICFGGPAAHLAHYQRELIEKRKWTSEEDFADLIALCQFLPGPASSQVGMGLGLMRGGYLGMVAAWLAFALPSVILLLIAAAGVKHFASFDPGWLHGLLAGVVAIVADAIWTMSKKLCPTSRHRALAIISGMLMLSVPHALSQIAVILLGAASGLLLLEASTKSNALNTPLEKANSGSKKGWILLLLFVVLPIAFNLLIAPKAPSLLAVYTSFSQTGSLVFGGGHVVLPMLQSEVVGPGWITDEQFLAGYGITQAMPGPIFTLSSYLGAIIGSNLAPGVLPFFSYAAAALLGIFAPSFAFLSLTLPLWHRLKAKPKVRKALGGINAAVVGLLIAALYDPVWTKAMTTHDASLSVVIILGSFLLLSVAKKPAWLVVLLSAGAGALLNL